MADSTPVALSFMEAWAYQTPYTQQWLVLYTGSGCETPTMVNLPRHRNMIQGALPKNAKLQSMALLERARTSRYIAFIAYVDDADWRKWCESLRNIHHSFPDLNSLVTVPRRCNVSDDYGAMPNETVHNNS